MPFCVCDMKLHGVNIFFWRRSFVITIFCYLFFINNLQAQNCASTNLGEAAPFSLFTFGNFRNTVGDQSWGRIAVGGNFTVDNFNIGAQGCLSNNGSRYDLVVRGNLRYNSGSVNNGSVAYGNNLQASPNLGASGAVLTNSSSIVNFGSTEAVLKVKSTYWSGLSTTGSINNNGFGTITFTGTNSGVNVFTVAANDIQAFNYLNVNINVPTTATTLINVSGNLSNMPQTTVTFNGSQINTSTAQAGFQTCPQSLIIWNIGSSTNSFTMNNVGFQGTILAPWATINSSGGEINGQLICNRLEQADNNASTIQIHCTLFQGCLPEQACAINAGSDLTICAGNTVTLTGINPTTGVWTALTTNTSGFSLGNTNNGVTNVGFTDTITTRIFSFVYSNNTCRDTINITVNALPTISDIIGNSIVIVNDSLTFTNTINGGTWASTNTNTATLSSTNGRGFAKGHGNTTIQYSIINVHGCSRTVQRNLNVAPRIKS